MMTYLSLGSNLGNRGSYLDQALGLIAERLGPILKKSSIYETDPWGFTADLPFLNLVIGIDSLLSPEKMIREILTIEEQMGRRRVEGYSSRNIDIDILFYGDRVILDDHLKIPHPLIQERRFILIPLAEIAASFVHPSLHRSIEDLLNDCQDFGRVIKQGLNPNFYYNFIAIEGNIGAGKTSLATRISQQFNAKLILEQFEDNAFLPKFYENPSKYAFPLELSFLASRYQQLKDQLPAQDLFKAFTVADYFIHKSFIFAGKNLDSDEFSLYTRLFKIIEASLPKPDLLVYLFLSVDHLKSNIEKRGRPYEKNIDFDYLEKIQAGYMEFLRQQTNMRTLIIDTNNLDFVGREEDYLKLLEIIGREYEPGITRIDAK
jgi:deoxyguanosine kinase